ncbi:peptidoglycan-associated lipoprotein Pal [Geomesophilobacter sediminis]|uniref:Peptidoglycan-associated lipoprotein n=1 Tax=Geomesophilobacter sediminis TaxID=2798584 RepID=A0A8J7LVK3_9BACT|nr:peptidoglycan-associated lipoprotein Pal [Geomesophilobacter sediminis]MBJ6725624.1 peptidoglycan-associated lipoprotein Pal [Geomesophilobacter sediminis]
MRKVLVGFLCCLVFAGCASQEAAKKSEPVASSATTAPAAPEAKQAPAIVESAPATPAPAPTAVAPKAEAPAQAVETPAQPVVSDSGNKAAPAALQEELQKIYFAFDSAELTQESRDALSKNADYLKNNTAVKIRIEGNCDERGSDEYNLALGERRAKAAKDYLETLGIPSDRLATISYGEERPADPGHNEEAWTKNRRDEFVIIK